MLYQVTIKFFIARLKDAVRLFGNYLWHVAIRRLRNHSTNLDSSHDESVLHQLVTTTMYQYLPYLESPGFLLEVRGPRNVSSCRESVRGAVHYIRKVHDVLVMLA